MNLYWRDNYDNAMSWVGSAYQSVAEWVFIHPVRTDAIIGAAVLGSLAAILSMRARTRRRLRRTLWGIRMKHSKNREAFEKSLISYGICDAIEEAVFRGDMTRASANNWYHSFANYYGMNELLPVHNQKTVKRGIKYRLTTGLHRVKSIIPGPKPGVDRVDLTYKPVTEKERKRSKYDLAPQAAE
jgi:hypothetical protein